MEVMPTTDDADVEAPVFQSSVGDFEESGLDLGGLGHCVLTGGRRMSGRPSRSSPPCGHTVRARQGLSGSYRIRSLSSDSSI